MRRVKSNGNVARHQLLCFAWLRAVTTFSHPGLTLNSPKAPWASPSRFACPAVLDCRKSMPRHRCQRRLVEPRRYSPPEAKPSAVTRLVTGSRGERTALIGRDRSA